MSILSDRSRSEGDIVLSGEDSTSGEASGWEDQVDHQNLKYKLIQAANAAVTLHSVLDQYNVFLESVYSPTGWTHRCPCPFPDHNDKNPSFGYNSTDDRFNCFGCNRSGRAVEFIAYMEDKPRVTAARELIGNSMTLAEISNLGTERFDYKRLDRLLFGYADTLRAFKRSNNNTPKAIEYASAVTWNLDVYLRKHVPFNSIILDDLEVRINKLKEQLEMYEERE